MEFRFALPVVLVFIVLPLLNYFYQRRNASKPTLTYSDVRLFDGLPGSWRVRLRRVPDILRASVWILLVIALARPQSGSGVEVIRGQGVDIVIAIDISSSMAALDFSPRNRLEAAKEVIGQFIVGREFDRIGLIAFARNPYHQAPLTLDYVVLRQLLNDIRLVPELDVVAGQIDGTAIGSAIASAVNMLRQGDAPSKVIILLTDGDNNAGIDPITAAEIASMYGIRIYTIGVGRSGEVPVPLRDGSTVMVESDLDEPTLQAIAEIGGGLYFRAEDIAGFQQIYDEIDRLERSDIERRLFVRWQDQAIWLLLPALILLIAEFILRETVFQTIP